jgi:hypothetical protein
MLLMTRKSEKGEGKLGGLVALALIAALALAAWNVAPVYIQYYDFKDKVNEICRTPKYKVRNGDEGITAMLMKEVTERRMTEWVGPESFTISTTDTSRQIRTYYEREVEVLPGWKKTLKFEFTADQPLI